MVSCQRCKQSTNGPQAFLLTCQGCSKTWHHRCHMPPVEDDELMRRLRAANMGDKANDLSTWTCRRCKKAALATPSVTSSREHTESSDDRKSLTIIPDTSMPTISHVSTAEIHVKQEQERSELSARPLSEENDRRESTEAAPVKHTFVAKRPKSSAPKLPLHAIQTCPTPPRNPDVQMTDLTPTRLTMQEETMRSPDRFLSQSSPHPEPMSVDIASTARPEVDVEMRIDDIPGESASTASQVSPPNDQASRPNPVSQVPPLVQTESLINEREREVRPADGAVMQPQVNRDAEDDDDPEDLYGPPVERRIIRILPSLAEELREQQRRAAAEKEKKRAPLAPEWILARHAQDLLWKDVPAVVGGRVRRKPTARKLGENGLNVNELVGYLTSRNSVREHKT